MSLRVANQTLACSSQLTYHPDPEFTSYTAIKTGNDLRVTIEVYTHAHAWRHGYTHICTLVAHSLSLSLIHSYTHIPFLFLFQKRADKLNITTEEILVFGVQEENQDVQCIMETIEKSNGTDSVICEIKNTPNFNINSVRVNLLLR